VTSSLSPERAETIEPQPCARAVASAARASLSVPAWFGLISAVLQAPRPAAASMRAAPVQMKSSATTCTPDPAAALKRAIASGSSSASGSSMATIG